MAETPDTPDCRHTSTADIRYLRKQTGHHPLHVPQIRESRSRVQVCPASDVQILTSVNFPVRIAEKVTSQAGVALPTANMNIEYPKA